MDQAAYDTVVKTFLHHIQRDLQEAASIAKAAEVCAASGNLQAAVRMVMGFEDPAHRAEEMFKAVLLIRRELMDDDID
jgi:hypothetical protein